MKVVYNHSHFLQPKMAPIVDIEVFTCAFVFVVFLHIGLCSILCVGRYGKWYIGLCTSIWVCVCVIFPNFSTSILEIGFTNKR